MASRLHPGSISHGARSQVTMHLLVTQLLIDGVAFNLPIKLKNLVAQTILAQWPKIWHQIFKNLKFLGISFEAVTTSLACRAWRCHWISLFATGFPYSPRDFFGTAVCDMGCPGHAPKTHPSTHKIPQRPTCLVKNFSYIDILLCELFLPPFMAYATFAPGQNVTEPYKGGPCHQLQVGAHNSTHRGL